MYADTHIVAGGRPEAAPCRGPPGPPGPVRVSSAMFSRMNRHHVGPLLLGLLSCATANAQAAPEAPSTARTPVETVVPERVLGAPFAPTTDEIMADVRHLASAEMAGRLSGSEPAKAAAKWIGDRFRRLGLEPAGDGDGFEQCFDRMTLVPVAAPASHGPEPDPESESESESEKPEGAKPEGPPAAEPSRKFEMRKLQCRNVLAWLPGTDEDLREEFVLIGAHFDHLGRRDGKTFHGADDNASGVAGMLAIARACAKGEIRPRRSILFVAFDAEEQALAGSRYFARHPPRSLQKLVAMINLDMIGRPRLLDKKQLSWPKRLVGIPDATAVGVLGTDSSPELAGIARAVCKAEKLPMFAPEDFGVLRDTIKKMADGRSDHAAFEQRRIPFLFFSTSENDDYHQPTDTVDKVDGESLRHIAGAVYRIVLAIDATDQRPTFVEKKAD